ncbi:procyclic form-specific polypeptide B1-alpha-like [Vitis riparia]|uniref:procyclic form-specific polypeptide B1-alpha-like n=1 Tax=Vitis riparia TaxID=96939 RepID=UPI00155A128F|nr:procyclic form-specific polypeptide B1-alpha-like [Vitis riparia]
MEISEKLLKFKFPILFAFVLFLLISCLFILAPSFVTIIAYFWPLLLSTALFLVAVLVFARTSPPDIDSSVDKAGEGLLDFVAGKPEPQPDLESEPEPEPDPELEPELEPEPIPAGESLKSE